MSKINLFLLVIAIFAVLYFVMTKANTALSNGQKAFQRETVTPEQQAEDIMDRAGISQ